MSKADFETVKQEYLKAENEQKKCSYKTRKCLSESFFGKFLCCCMKVKDNLNIPWDEMTTMQQKYRIKRLWMKARRVFLFQRIKLADDKNKKNKHFNKDDDGEDILENINNGTENEWKWYIIRQENTLPQLWSFLTNTLTVYALFTTPFVLVFKESSENLRSFEMFVDVCFTLDIVMNFFKLSANQKESEFKQYRLDYLKSFFIFDCLAALPGLVTAEAQGVNFTKLARFIHWNRFFD